MARLLILSVLLLTAAHLSPGDAAETRPTAPGWQEVAIAKDGPAITVTSRLNSDVISLKLGGGHVDVLRNQPALFSIDKRRVSVDHVALIEPLRRGLPDAALAAYREFVNADLQKRGWKEVAAERMSFLAGGRAPAIYWTMQTEAGPAGQKTTVLLCTAAAIAGSSIVALTGIAEDAQGEPTKRILTDTLATLESKNVAPLAGEAITRLRREAQYFVYRVSGRSNVILLNDELASEKDRRKGSDDIQQLILSSSDMVNAAALAVAGSPNGPFMTFVNDGRSQHTILIHAYDSAIDSFEYSDTTGSRSMLEAGNNLAGVEAIRKPNSTSRIWVVKKEQLKAVLSGMIVGSADLLAVARKIHLGPLGTFGNSVADAKRTDFFKWFHLEQIGQSPGADGGTIINYSPGAPKFRSLVTVTLHLAKEGWIRSADLILKRRFLEDPREESNARDISKSFIASAAMKGDWKRIHRLHDEIFYLGSAKMFINKSTAKDIAIPLLPSDGYQVFTGRREHFVDMLSHSRLWMENGVVNGEAALLISIGSGG